MRSTVLIILVTALAGMTSCNMGSFYANKRIDHSGEKMLSTASVKTARELHFHETATEKPLGDSVKAEFSGCTESAGQKQLVIKPTKTEGPVKERAFRMTDIQTARLLAGRVSTNMKKMNEKLSAPLKNLSKRIAASNESSVNFDALDWNWTIIAVVTLGVSFVLTFFLPGLPLTLWAFLVAWTGLFLSLIIAVFFIFIAFAMLYILSFAWLWTE